MLYFPIHSPVEEIKHELFEKKKVHVFIKRDDLIHPFISGNKWRKLKYILADARSLDKNHIVTFGGAFSNHLLATACAGAKFGFKTTGIVRGEKHDRLNNTLFLCEQFGMDLQYVDREEYRRKEEIFEAIFGNDDQAYFIPEGGSSTLAMPGCGELVEELGETFDHIFLACGTGATMAGITQSVHTKKLKTLVEGIAVLKGADFLENDIRKLIGSDPRFKLHTNYHEGGYAKVNAEYLEWLKNFNASGLLLDHVYTGKMMRAVFDLIEHDYFKSGAKILTIHTGGLIGFLGLNQR
ncbi:1-aminocyclopropane-1-carboxylate deaminase/D-cysteine desulfhydrase [Solitalea koreensis]|uniref:1-aminocyclopropane-1-carboxylate deaminase n=1 Tax=Solitalea koreensis TaxID=543615 RepID=A0A521DX95_9SPHI|nr:pyridoxal-phosphate dependent enzyme [Solitalea koreensis]SMO76218.1 1-aminocyclopropane-1-carboxylate deaminase [Solitalea koreensis]